MTILHGISIKISNLNKYIDKYSKQQWRFNYESF